MTFTASIEEKLGRKLTADERKIVAAIEDIYKRHQHTTTVYESALMPFLGRQVFYTYWQGYNLWPTPPRDPWQTWLYIANFLRQQRKPWPPFSQGDHLHRGGRCPSGRMGAEETHPGLEEAADRV